MLSSTQHSAPIVRNLQRALAAISQDPADLEDAVIHICIAVDGTSRAQGMRGRSGFVKVVNDIESVALSFGMKGNMLRYNTEASLQAKAEGERVSDLYSFGELLYLAMRCTILHGDPSGAPITFNDSGTFGCENHIHTFPRWVIAGLIVGLIAHPANATHVADIGHVTFSTKGTLLLSNLWGQLAYVHNFLGIRTADIPQRQ